ncbi:MAG: hypothetical protein WB643_12920 [Candidatus Bathyarchaeia archaeon]
MVIGLVPAVRLSQGDYDAFVEKGRVNATASVAWVELAEEILTRFI